MVINDDNQENVLKTRRESTLKRLREIVGTRAREIGGIFTPKTRHKLLGITKLPGRPQLTYDSTNNERYRIRESVKLGLLDLQIFIECAEERDVQKTVTKETLTPIIDALLSHPIDDQAEPDFQRAEIAQLFIEKGFDYLEAMQIPPHDHELIEKAITLSKFLVEHVNREHPKKLQRHFRYGGAY